MTIAASDARYFEGASCASSSNHLPLFLYVRATPFALCLCTVSYSRGPCRFAVAIDCISLSLIQQTTTKVVLYQCNLLALFAVKEHRRAVPAR